MISVDNLTVSFGGWDLFREVSFLINAKDRIGLVGKNGAGKSTMLKVLIGEQPALVGNRFAQRRLHGRLPAATDEGGRHDHAVRRNRIGLFGSDRTRTRNRATEPRDRRADGLRKRGVRKAAAPVERCDRPLSHSRRDEPRGGGRKDAARTGLPTKRLRTGDQRVQRRMADAHRTGEAAASPGRRYSCSTNPRITSTSRASDGSKTT